MFTFLYNICLCETTPISTNFALIFKLMQVGVDPPYLMPYCSTEHRSLLSASWRIGTAVWGGAFTKKYPSRPPGRLFKFNSWPSPSCCSMVDAAMNCLMVVVRRYLLPQRTAFCDDTGPAVFKMADIMVRLDMTVPAGGPKVAFLLKVWNKKNSH